MKKFRQILEGTISSSEKTQTVQLESDAAYAASLKKIAMDKQIASLSNRDRNTLTRIADMMKNANNDRKEDISENDMSLDDIKKKWAKEIIAYQDGDINQLPGSAEMDLYGYRDDDAIKTDDADEFEDFVMGLQMAKYKKESVDEIWSPIKKIAGKIKDKVTGSNAPAKKTHNPVTAFSSPEYLGARLKIAKQKLRDAQEKAKKAAADGNEKGMDHWNEVEMNRQADIEKLQKKAKKARSEEAIDENLRKDIAQMSAKFPEGSTVKLKNGKTGKVLGVTKDRVHVGIGDETSYHAPTAIEETTLAQQQKDKTKSQHDAHAKRMNKSARDSIKKYDQVKKDREKVSGVNEAIETGDYKIDSEKSQFNDGHRGKVVHKEKGTTMYLGGMSWKTPAAAKAHAHAYLVGYERGGETGAKNSQANYVDQNMDKRMNAKKESFKSYTEGAKEDALRAIKNDSDFKRVKDVDIRATTADMKLAKKNPIQQLRKISDYGKGQIEFLNNKKLKLTKKEADALLRGFDAMKKPQDKEKYQTMISKDSAGLKHILKIVNK